MVMSNVENIKSLAKRGIPIASLDKSLLRPIECCR